MLVITSARICDPRSRPLPAPKLSPSRVTADAPVSMRIWFDMTASAHPVVFRPVIERLRSAGHDVRITARDYAQTLGLLDLYGLDHVTIGRHAGASRPRKVLALAQRTAKLYRWARGSFDLAVAH